MLPDPLPLPPPAQPGTTAALTFRAEHSKGDGADLLVRVQRSGSEGSVIIVAGSLSGVDDVLTRLLVTEAVVTVAVLAGVAAVGSIVVRVGLRPLDDIGRTASEIAGGDLASRIGRTDERTEVGRLGRSLNEMLHQIEVAFAEREASEEALRRSDERLRRFVADASHELRTPLTAIAAYAELLERATQGHSDDVGRHAGRIRHENGRMALLVADLLLLSRLDQGRPLDHEPVDLGLLASEAVDAARAVDPARAITLAVDGLVEVNGDRARLRQILDNLMSNARVHTPAGTPVEVDVRPVADRAVVRVTDHGPGIDDDQSEHVFERFYRVDASRRRGGVETVDGADRVPGSGLGLAIVKAIADAHDGTVTVAPTPGGGATFTVSLALLDPGPSDPVVGQAAEDGPTSPVTALAP
jgi:two-component system OmpR family sensor kinase